MPNAFNANSLHSSTHIRLYTDARRALFVTGGEAELIGACGLSCRDGGTEELFLLFDGASEVEGGDEG